jgi:lia operon protein LiaG
VSVGFLVYGLTHRANVTGISEIFRLKNSSFNRTYTIQKDENVPLKNCSKMNFNFSNADVIVHTVDASNLRIVQNSTSALKDREKFAVTRGTNDITVKVERINRSYGIFQLNFSEKIDIYVPKNYMKSLSIYTASGDIIFASDVKMDDIEIDQNSGDFESEYNIVSNNMYVNSTSGDVSINNLASKHYDIRSISGDVNINLLSGSGQVKATSGDINLSIPEKSGFEFYGNCISGNINSNFPINYENEKHSSASAKIGSGPYERIDISTVSGDINISKK